MKPRIGVSGPDFGGVVAWVFTWFAIARAGGRAVRLTPRRRQSLDGLDGLVIGGGVDIADTLPEDDEALAEPRSGVRRLLFRLTAPLRTLIRWVFRVRNVPKGDRARDMLEVRLLRTAREQGMPTLGICRGAQMMALIEGGSLAQDVGAPFEHRDTLWTPLPARDIVVEPNSKLHGRLGGAQHKVNSLHRHAVASVPAPMFIVAREAGAPITQAIEHSARPFWLGVQWHPEYMPQDSAQHQLFRALVACAAERRRASHTTRGAERESARARAVSPDAHPSRSM